MSLCSPTTSFTLRGRDECPSSEGRTQPRNAASSLHRDLMELVVSLKKPTELAATAWRVRVGPPISVNMHDGALWKALEMKTRSPEKFTDVSEVMVPTENGFLSNSMMTIAMNTLVLKRIWINGQLICVPAFASRHWRSVPIERSPICTSNSTSKVSLTSCFFFCDGAHNMNRGWSAHSLCIFSFTLHCTCSNVSFSKKSTSRKPLRCSWKILH